MTAPRGSVAVGNCTCVPGYFLVNNSCQICAANTYCADGYIQSACPGNSTTNGKLGQTNLVACECKGGFIKPLGGLREASVSVVQWDWQGSARQVYTDFPNMQDNTQWVISIRFRVKTGGGWQGIAGMMYGVVERGWGLWFQGNANLFWSGPGNLGGLKPELEKWQTLIIRRDVDSLVFDLRTESTGVQTSHSIGWSGSTTVHKQMTFGG